MHWIGWRHAACDTARAPGKVHKLSPTAPLVRQAFNRSAGPVDLLEGI
jgi:hypothetical protein